MCCRQACTIQLEESVIITGGKYEEKRVEQYNLAGSMGRLPDLKTYRQTHACGLYLQEDGKVVSSTIAETFRIVQPL